MSELKDRIFEYNSDDLIWNFDDSNTPHINTKGISPEYVKLDPMPCAKHDINIITKYIEKIEKAFPVNAIMQYHIIPFEGVDRCNAMAHSGKIWNSKEELQKKHIIECDIIFYGKRTMIHPAMSKYLVAHEYGHQADNWIQECIRTELIDIESKKENKDDVIDWSYKDMNDYCDKIYADMRGIEIKSGYGGGRWIDNIGEIIADDFRIVVGKTDIEFYPHSCTHPLKDKNVIDFWKKWKIKIGKFNDTLNKMTL